MSKVSDQKWADVRSMAEELEQMASATVLKACDIGDELRQLRLTMTSEKFSGLVAQKLNRERRWADRMIVLSFRRAEVVKALADGSNDSIVACYEAVKELPAPEHEQAERKQWPREKRGPQKGSEKAGRPKATEKRKAKEPRPSKASWIAIAQSYGLLPHSSGSRQRQQLQMRLKEVDPAIEFTAGGLDDAMATRVGAACARLAEDDPKAEVRKRMKPKQIDKFEHYVEAEIQERLQEALAPMLDEYNRWHEQHLEVINAYQGVFTQDEYKRLIGAVHPDRYPELSDSGRKRLEGAFNVLSERKTALCRGDAPSSSTLPKTVSDLMGMRK